MDANMVLGHRFSIGAVVSSGGHWKMPVNIFVITEGYVLLLELSG